MWRVAIEKGVLNGRVTLPGEVSSLTQKKLHVIFVSHGIGIHSPGYPAAVVIMAEQFILLFKSLSINGYREQL